MEFLLYFLSRYCVRYVGGCVLCFGNHGRFTLPLFGFSSRCDDDCVPFGNFTFNKMDGCRKSNRLLLSLRFCRSIKSTNENKRNDQFPIKRVANADGMRCMKCERECVVRTQQIHCWLFGRTHTVADNAVSLLKSDNKPLVSAFVMLACEKL